MGVGVEARDATLVVRWIGAHADAVEVGCGGTILKLASGGRPLAVTWVVWSAEGTRQQEARDSAELFLTQAKSKTVALQAFRDGFFPYQGQEIKEEFEALKTRLSPDVIFTHFRDDLHQDHRLISELTSNTFRHKLILEYEISTYDGDMGESNLLVEFDASF